MAANEILPFATDGGANVLTQAEYAADTQRTSGNVPGVARSKLVNKAARQAAFVSAMVGQFVADQAGADVIDNGDIATFETNFINAIAAVVRSAQQVNGQCRLVVTNPTTLTLMPHNGRYLIVGGLPRQIPGGGVAISNAGLTASTLRYVYAYMNGGSLALEFSSTGHSLDAATGVEVKNGDPSRSLVGMIYTTASSQFADSFTQRFCANWFNRRPRAAVATLLVDTNFSTVVSSEITASLRASALYWSNSGAYSLIANGSVSNNTAGGIVGFEGRINGGVFGTEARSTIATAAQYECLVSASHSENIAEGLVTASAYGYVSSGSTATLYGTATVNLTVQA